MICLHRFDDDAICAIQLALGEMFRLGHDYIDTEGIIAGVLKFLLTTSPVVIRRPDILGEVDYRDYLRAMEETIGRGAGLIYDQVMTPLCKKAFEDAYQTTSHKIDLEQLSKAMLKDPDSKASKIIRMLKNRKKEGTELKD